MSTNSNGSRAVMKASKMSMADIAAALRRQAGRPVEDHTGLKGNFDFQIEWAPEETPDSADPSLFTVLKEQLGLKLQSAKGITEILIVDQITQPNHDSDFLYRFRRLLPVLDSEIGGSILGLVWVNRHWR
jgi:uncharacterized protein (TIGR03435 family)